ncbi:MAG: glycosyltransferase family 2 protein, partial [Promethearchaeota archaeon]
MILKNNHLKGNSHINGIYRIIYPMNTFDYYSESYREKITISIIIPLYNEEKSIESVLKRIPNYPNYEIIVVDDGSTDNSVQKVKEIRRDNILILQHQTNLGYGAALMTGFEFANGDIIVTMDSDGQHKPEEIEKIINPILQDKADIVIGSRYLGECEYKVPLYTRIGEYCIKICFLTLFRQRIGNNQSGYRCFKREVINAIHDTISVGMGFTTELLFKAALKNFKIVEVPISLNSRNHGKSYVKLFKLLK